MRTVQTEILVIGGGATGAGVARDLSMRGFQTILVERGDLTHGTTGRYHGLLHSGARYVVRDPLAARECIEENRILRRILPHCIEDTGGFFVLTPWDEPDYVPRFVAGCHSAGIPVEELSIPHMLRQEPLLNPQITRCFRVPDGSADSFRSTDANAASAREYGAQILTYHPVIRLLTAGRVTGALIHNLVTDEEIQIEADMVVNAAGAWTGKIAATAGLQVRIVPGKGSMLAVNHRILNTVVNRCRMCADADIIVPAHTVAVIGTTDIPVKDPDRLSIEPWEVQLMLEEGEKLVPGFKEMRMLRAWAGVRPLYREVDAQQAPGFAESQADNRQMPRSYVLLDHEARDGVAGLITITSGKWTTYRKMAEAAADLVCARLGVQRPGRTHLESLPGADEHSRSGKPAYHILGAPLDRVEAGPRQPPTRSGQGEPAPGLRYSDLVCECELATVEDVRQAILEGNAQTIDDVRRDVRLGMGPCQGGFCTLRAAGLMHSLGRAEVGKTNVALRDFLQERWKGLLPILWGQQLRQERLNELIYLNLLNAGGLPGPRASRLAPAMYEPSDSSQPAAVDSTPRPANPYLAQVGPEGESGKENRSITDVIIVGAGLAGLASAWRLGLRGLKGRVIARGWGALFWNAGCIDVLGVSPLDPQALVDCPYEALVHLIQAQPEHPYARIGLNDLDTSLRLFQDLCSQAGYPLHGSLETNWFLPTALGTFRPTCLAPLTMIAGDMKVATPVLIVGFASYLDFSPSWIAANLEKNGIPARGILIDLPSLKDQRLITTRVLAQLFDKPEFRAEVAQALKLSPGAPAGPGTARIGFPAVLGLDRAPEALHDLEERLGVPVFEIPGLPPSVPGIRLHNLLVKAIEGTGVRVFDGMQVTAAGAEDGHLVQVWSEAAARRRAHRARNFVLATGGILGGGSRASYDGSLHETVFHLPVRWPSQRSEWLAADFLAPTGHPIFRSGLPVNASFQPVDGSGQVLYKNLWATGASLAGCDPVWERSLEGIALATGYIVGERIEI